MSFESKTKIEYLMELASRDRTWLLELNAWFLVED